MKGYIYLLLAALCYSSMGVLVKALSVDFEPMTQTFLRLLFSGLLTFSLVIVLKKHLLLKHKEDYPLIVLMGIFGYACQILFYTYALYYTTIGNTLFITSAYPIFTALLAYVFLKEKITKHLVVALVLLIVSLYLFFNPQRIAESQFLLGNIFAVLTALCVGIYIVCSRIMTKRGNAPETVTLWSVAIAIATSGIGAVSFETFTIPTTPYPFFLLLLFGFFNFAAFNLMNKGFTTVPAGPGTLVMMIEAVIGAFLGFLFYKEIPSVSFTIGALVLFLAVYIAVFKPRRLN